MASHTVAAEACGRGRAGPSLSCTHQRHDGARSSEHCTILLNGSIIFGNI